jgi:dihydroorotate dehydrogenase
MPNLQPVHAVPMRSSDNTLLASSSMQGSWAVSFGMPSKSPTVWRADIEATRDALPRHKILSVSVVATPDEDWTIDDLADDFALCARWAVESGADCIEANFSCPNVASADGQLYQQPRLAGLVAARIRHAIGSKPLLIKIGHVPQERLAEELVDALAAHANALVMVNCISAQVVDSRKDALFDGQKRGIAGHAIGDAALDQIRLFVRAIRRNRLNLALIGVGGISDIENVQAHLSAGSQAVQLGTAAMLDPALGFQLRRSLALVREPGIK